LLEFNVRLKARNGNNILLSRIYFNDDKIFDMRFSAIISKNVENPESKAGGFEKSQPVK
jgi:protocatechuate 3,4-dioxygenase beta subunit